MGRLDSVWQDLRHAARTLVRRPMVTGVAVVSLALGIGVNTAIFSVFDRLMLHRLPVADSQAIVNVTSPGPRPGSASTGNAGGRDAVFSHPLFRDLERMQSAFSAIAAHAGTSVNLAYQGETMSGDGVLVSGGYFSALGLKPAIGRLLTADDDRVGAPSNAVVLSHAYWTRRFGANPAVLNGTLTVNGLPMTIAGVAPDGFLGLTTMDRVDVFIPLAEAERFRGRNVLDSRRDHWLYVFGRLNAGVTRERAEILLGSAFSALIRDVEFPLQQDGLDARERPAFLARTIVLEDGSRGSFRGRGEARTVLSLLFVVTGLVLLIACANVANLLLARAADRSTEVAVRLALGASASRMLRLLLTEACLLGLAGGAAALLVARMTVVGVLSIMPVDSQAVITFEFNGPLLLFAGLMGLGTGLLFGAFPAVHAVRTSLAARMSQSGRAGSSRTASRFRTSLATAQVALATALLAQAGLFIVSLVNVAKEDLGIRRDGLVTFAVSPRLNGYTRPQSQALFEQVEDRLAGMPGVQLVSASTIRFLSGEAARNNLSVEGFEATPDSDLAASYTHVGPGYFSTLGIPLIAGREFTRADAGEAPTVAIVNQAFVRKFRLGSDAVGKRIALGRGRQPDIEIVGLVADAKYSRVREGATAQFYLPYRQSNAGTLNFYVRSTTGAAAMFPAIVETVRALDATLPVDRLRTMDEQVADGTAPNRILTLLSSAFATLATLLAGIGLYAVLAYSVTQRGREFGVRMALGARTADIARLVLSQVGRITITGGLIGGALALGLSRLGQAMLFGVDEFSGRVAGGATAVVIAVALFAALLPMRRATRVDPATALRAE